VDDLASTGSPVQYAVDYLASTGTLCGGWRDSSDPAATVPLASTMVSDTSCDDSDPWRSEEPCVAVATAPPTVWSMNHSVAAQVRV